MWQSRSLFNVLNKDIVQDIIDKCDGAQHQLDAFEMPIFVEPGAQFACFNREMSNGELIRYDAIPWYRKCAGAKEIKPRRHRLVLCGQQFLILNCVCPQSATFKKHMIFGDNLDVFYVIYLSKEPIFDFQPLQQHKKQVMPDSLIIEARAALTNRTVNGAFEFLKEHGLTVTRKQLHNQSRNVRSVIKSWMSSPKTIAQALEEHCAKRARLTEQKSAHVEIKCARGASPAPELAPELAPEPAPEYEPYPEQSEKTIAQALEEHCAKRARLTEQKSAHVEIKCARGAASPAPEAAPEAAPEPAPEYEPYPELPPEFEPYLEHSEPEPEPSCSVDPPHPPTSSLQSKIKRIWSTNAYENGEHSFFVKKSTDSTSFVEVKLSEYDELTCTLRSCKNRLQKSCDHIKAVLPLLPPDRRENVMSTLSARAPSAPWVYEPDKRGHGRVFRQKFGYRDMGELSRGVAPAPAPVELKPVELKVVKDEEEHSDDDDIMETMWKLTAKKRRC